MTCQDHSSRACVCVCGQTLRRHAPSLVILQAPTRRFQKVCPLLASCFECIPAHVLLKMSFTCLHLVSENSMSLKSGVAAVAVVLTEGVEFGRNCLFRESEIDEACPLLGDFASSSRDDFRRRAPCWRRFVSASLPMFFPRCHDFFLRLLLLKLN